MTQSLQIRLLLHIAAQTDRVGTLFSSTTILFPTVVSCLPHCPQLLVWFCINIGFFQTSPYSFPNALVTLPNWSHYTNLLFVYFHCKVFRTHYSCSTVACPYFSQMEAPRQYSNHTLHCERASYICSCLMAFWIGSIIFQKKGNLNLYRKTASSYYWVIPCFAMLVVIYCAIMPLCNERLPAYFKNTHDHSPSFFTNKEHWLIFTSFGAYTLC